MVKFSFFWVVRTKPERRAELRLLFCLGATGTSEQWRVHRRLEENKKNNKERIPILRLRMGDKVFFLFFFFLFFWFFFLFEQIECYFVG